MDKSVTKHDGSRLFDYSYSCISYSYGKSLLLLFYATGCKEPHRNKSDTCEK